MFAETKMSEVGPVVALETQNELSSVPQNLVVADPGKAQVTTQFDENVDSSENHIHSECDPTFTMDTIAVGDLASYLQRPALIHEYAWDQNPQSVRQIKPWHLFFSNVAIKKKIDNYAFINCKLHIKVLINATPFLYGYSLVAYEPLTNFGNGPVVTGDAELVTTQLSQLPHVWISPQDNQGGEMTLPFFYDVDWLPLTSAAALMDMGTLHIFDPAQLQAANGSVGQSVTVQIFAWAEDVKLSGPTYEVAVQSKFSTKWDEYAKKPISTVSSSVAAVASKLKTLPVIGPFAKATEIGANAVASVARLFGFTNPPNISNVEPVRHAAYHAMCSAEISVPADTFTLDPKCELSVDPRTVGLTGEDEMTIAYLAGKDSYIGSFLWETSDAPGVDMMNLPVSPINYNITTNGVDGHEYAMTPAAMVTENFQYWRGDIIVRLKVVCSQYHYGRLRIVWDPVANPISETLTATTSLNRVVDISSEQEIEIRIPYNQARHWLTTPTIQLFRYLSTKGNILAHYYNPEFFNGTLHAYVLNTLSAPEPSASVKVMIFARCAENFEVMVPRTPLDATFSYFAPQSSAMHSISGMADDEPDQNQYSVYGGEVVRSMRKVMRRAMPGVPLVTDQQIPIDAFAADLRFERSIFPMPNGYDPTSPTVAENLSNSENLSAYTWSLHSAFTTLVPCYKGMRGSMYWHQELQDFDANRPWKPSFEMARYVEDPRLLAGRLINDTVSGVAGNYPSIVSAIARFSSASNGTGKRVGQTLNSANPLEGQSVLCPNMFNYRFDTTRVSAFTTGQNRLRARNESLHTIVYYRPLNMAVPTSAPKSIHVRRYYSIGPDFSTFFFCCVPKLYRYSQVPGAQFLPP